MRMLEIGLVGVVLVARGPARGDAASVALPDTTVAIRTFQFRPATLTVPQGSRVVWSNTDEIEHTVTAGSPDSASGGFNGMLKSRGMTFAFRFGRPGTYAYYCDRHHFMRGEIRVTSTGEN